MLKNTQLMGLFPPVAIFSLLFPYPPKAGRAMKHPPTKFAVPSATSSRFALSCMPAKSVDPPRLLAATVDSKKPSRAIRNEVLMASRMCVICEGTKGKRKVKRRPEAALMGPMMARPWESQPSLEQRMVATTTMMKRSGT